MRSELVQATDLLQRNTPEALEEALGLLQNTVYSFSMKVCGHREDAEDTMQDVLFSSLKYLTTLKDAQALAVWLYTVTRNRCRRKRSKSVYAPKQILSLHELMPDGTEIERLLKDKRQTPEASLLHAEQHQMVHQAVLAIPDMLRIVLVLHDMEDLTTDQVAQILDLKPGTVRVRLHRARLHVRAEMSRMLDTPLVESNKSNISTEIAPAQVKHVCSAECRTMFANLSEYLDGNVEAATCESMRQHIEACPSCVAFLLNLRDAIDRCRSLEVTCAPLITSRLRALLTEEYLRLQSLPS